MSGKAVRRQPAAASARPAVPRLIDPCHAVSTSGSLTDIYTLFDPDHPDRLPGPLDPVVVRTALALLTQIVGLPLADIDLAPPQLSIRFATHELPDEVARVMGRERMRYQGWRRILLDAQMFATRRVVDANPWDGLVRVARLTVGEVEAAVLRTLERLMPGVTPAEINFARAIEVEAGLNKKQRQTFRRALRVVSRLHDHHLAVASGLLPPHFRPLPPQDRCQNHLPLPPRLAAAFAGAADTHRLSAAYGWTVAVRSNLIAEGADPSPADMADAGVWERLALTDPVSFGIDLQRGTWAIYRSRLADMLVGAGAPDPRLATVAASWSELASEVRATGRRSCVLSALAVPAKAQGLRPSEVTPQWVAELIAAASTRATETRICKAGLLLDEVRSEGTIAAHLLPAIPTGVVRQPRVRKVPATVPPKPLPAPVEQAWIDLFVELRRAGVSEDDLKPLYALRTAAIAEGLCPRDVDRACIEAWQGQGDHRRAAQLAMSARLLDRVRGCPNLNDLLPVAPIGKVKDRRRSAPALPAGIAAELAQLLEQQGAAASTRREAEAAVSALAHVLAERVSHPATSLIELLRAERGGLDWGAHAGRADEYDDVLRRLVAFVDLPWTPGWRALQTAAVAAGVSMRDNPLPALMPRAEGCEPTELDIYWAREIDRSLRAAVRYDLARTFAANIARLDALHDVPALATSGLLPPRLGPIRAEPAARPAPKAAPKPDPAGGAWTLLAAAVRAIGGNADLLSALAPAAKLEGLGPMDITPVWIDRQMSTPQGRVSKRVLRSACYLLDALREDARIPAELLPVEPTGVARLKRPYRPRSA